MIYFELIVYCQTILCCFVLFYVFVVVCIYLFINLVIYLFINYAQTCNSSKNLKQDFAMPTHTVSMSNSIKK